MARVAPQVCWVKYWAWPWPLVRSGPLTSPLAVALPLIPNPSPSPSPCASLSLSWWRCTQTPSTRSSSVLGSCSRQAMVPTFKRT
eukprot:5914997-Prymnesium_polylepis.1